MTAPSKNRQSAYPATVADLLPEARSLAARLGELPSRNRLMTELHIGAPKARDLLAELRRLHLVTDTAEPEPDTPDGAEPEPAEVVPGPTDTAPAEPTAPDPGASPEPTADGPDTTADTAEAEPEPSAPATPDTDPDTTPAPDPAPADAEPAVRSRSRVSVWPVLLLTLPAFAAVWSGWVSLGGMAGFGVVHPLPGIADHLSLNTAITLPIGVEVYAAYALWVWLSAGIPDRARKFAKVSAIASLVTGAAGQVTYHLLSAAHYTQAPWPVTMLVACLPVAVLGMGAALAHLVRDHQ
ncbi:ABC transporter permease [Actinocatenispora sera]|uniref:ABC transporter permease n=1 Tax=Actinocatenispora sera TaxID=390989 RepID=UPI00341174AB